MANNRNPVTRTIPVANEDLTSGICLPGSISWCVEAKPESKVSGNKIIYSKVIVCLLSFALQEHKLKQHTLNNS